MITPEQQMRDDLRHIVLKAVASRAPAALSVRQLMAPIQKDAYFKFEPEDVEAALEFQRGFGNVTFVYDDFGSTKFWQATSSGILKFERS